MATQGIRSTKTYIWYLKDVLGTGATSSVYLGRHKKTGDVVAVKMFNHMSYMRPHDVQKREFDVLHKLKHKNIIHLHVIEEDQISKQPVIVMELCTGGSLYTYLDTPENLYGLKEKEFLQVITDVSAGMKHLRENGIVHRDIKPGNIMMVKGENGIFIYKLADFGAARELDDDEAFMSLYGTEEYLHPDLYERAVMGKRNRTEFTAQTDLWSLGVTFYHTATGSLPFRPHGGRNNRDVMHEITNTKKSGVISGVQEQPNGPIIWDRELPQTCHFSPDMRRQVTTLLARTMECDIRKMWTFDDFFDFVQQLINKRPIDVFAAPTCESHIIYVEPEKDVAEFQNKMAHLTGIQPDTQGLLWDKEIFDLARCMRCRDLPHTSLEKSLILVRMGAEVFPPLRSPTLPNQPKTATHFSVQHDCTLAKNVSAVMCYYVNVVGWFSRIESLITETVKAIIVVLRMDYLKLRSKHSAVKGFCLQADCKWRTLERLLPLLKLTALDKASSAKLDEIKVCIVKCKERLYELNKVCDQVEASLDMVEKTAIQDDYLSSQWEGIRQQYALPQDKIGRLKVLCEEGLDTYKRFKKDKQIKQLSYNEEQIHRMDKEKLAKKMVIAKKIYDDLLDILKELHKKFGTWHGTGSETRKFQDQLTSAKYRLPDLPYEYQKVLAELGKIEERVNELARHQSGSAPVNQPQAAPEMTEVMTSITESFPPPTSGFSSIQRGGASVRSDSLMASVQQLIKDLPLDSLGMVPVPKAVKESLQQYEDGLNSFKAQLDSGHNSLPRNYSDNRFT